MVETEDKAYPSLDSWGGNHGISRTGALSVLTEHTPLPVGRVVRGPCVKREAHLHRYKIGTSLFHMT